MGGASSKAEGGLASEAGIMKEQARHVRPLNDGGNLLTRPSDGENSNGVSNNA
jgi:hypothetical protein